jgi:hypothetical protein
LRGIDAVIAMRFVDDGSGHLVITSLDEIAAAPEGPHIARNA